jgi:hypothetical protein
LPLLGKNFYFNHPLLIKKRLNEKLKLRSRIDFSIGDIKVPYYGGTGQAKLYFDYLNAKTQTNGYLSLGFEHIFVTSKHVSLFWGVEAFGSYNQTFIQYSDTVGVYKENYSHKTFGGNILFGGTIQIVPHLALSVESFIRFHHQTAYNDNLQGYTTNPRWGLIPSDVKFDFIFWDFQPLGALILLYQF